MSTQSPKPQTIDEFIAGYPVPVQELMQKLRQVIRAAAPEARETINYGIPTFTLEGNLVHFAAARNHIGFYPAPSGIEKFKDELSGYELSKGTVKFPLDKPLPYDLITRIVAFRVQENLDKAARKKKR